MGVALYPEKEIEMNVKLCDRCDERLHDGAFALLKYDPVRGPTTYLELCAACKAAFVDFMNQYGETL
jgi:hypothetical protein